jgi:Uma2 family endonuclease
MGQPAEKLPAPRTTLAELEAAPQGVVAELVRGMLHTFPRPAPRHARAATRLGRHLGPFDDDPGNPGGWVILIEPEVHFPDREVPSEVEALDPDLAGWRIERMPQLPETAYFDVPPDWVCEVLSPSTVRFDRGEKMPIYAHAGVKHAWLLDPIARTLEVFELLPDRSWKLVGVHVNDARVRIVPFEALELDLRVLWT